MAIFRLWITCHLKRLEEQTNNDANLKDWHFIVIFIKRGNMTDNFSSGRHYDAINQGRLNILDDHPTYRYNCLKKDVSELEKNSVAIGLILSDQYDYFVDSYETGFVDKQEESNFLKHCWGIFDKKTSKDKLSWLKSVGFRTVFKYSGPVVKEALFSRNDNQVQFTESDMDDLILRALESASDQFSNETVSVSLDHDSYEEAKEIINSLSYNEYSVIRGIVWQVVNFCKYKRSDSAFHALKIENILYNIKCFDDCILSLDAAYLVTLSRLCFDLKYISYEEMLGYILGVYFEVKGKYSNWSEFSKFFLLGSFVIGKENIFLYNTFYLSKQALEPRWGSPWLRGPLN